MGAEVKILQCPQTNNIHGVLALRKFHYCGFSKLSRYISKNLANAILWAIYFVTAYIILMRFLAKGPFLYYVRT